MPWKQKIEQKRSLKELTTFGIGGAADYFLEVHDIPSMQEAILYCKEENLSYFILGKGSNLLFDDRGFAGMVIANKIQSLEKIDQTIWKAGAGYSFSLLGSQTARQGLGGLEFASGIPGSVGGAVFMNAGANGRETCESLISVDFVDSNGKLVTYLKEELTFAYRYSSFQDIKGAIVGAAFKLEGSPEARQKQLEIIQYRKNTQPYNAKSAGCVFRNPSCAHAGALIDKSGLKGQSIGGAEVSQMHANFIINTGNATTSDILNLIKHIQHSVKEATGYVLEHEVRCIPYCLDSSGEDND